ncbi:MAG: cytochrome c [Bacteroidetes bacterium]|nr:cytochrome c [Bacteroidota bacterium]MBK8659114.1 cytochrome c [Bacteroidota bacterium]
MYKTKFSSLVVAALFFITGCGGSDNKTEADNSEAPQSMIADEPVDDGQGIGKFKDVTLAAIDEKLAKEGQVVFDAKCSACHKTTAQKVVGPGLAGVTAKRKPAWILNMITNPVEMTQKDPAAKDLLAEHLTQMTFQDVSDEDAKKLLEYLRYNDQEGGEEKEEAKK